MILPGLDVHVKPPLASCFRAFDVGVPDLERQHFLFHGERIAERRFDLFFKALILGHERATLPPQTRILDTGRQDSGYRNKLCSNA
jgi:hypothetical protein